MSPGRSEETRLRTELTAAAITGARDDANRADSKVSSLLNVSAIASTILAALAAYARTRIPVSAAAALAGAAVLAAAALIMLLAVIWPRLHGAKNGDIMPSHQGLFTAASIEDLRAWQSEELKVHSKISVAKYRQVRAAVALLVVAFISLGLGLLLIAVR